MKHFLIETIIVKFVWPFSLMSTVQTERAFQKQPQLFLASKKHANAEKKQRYVKSIGLKIETPKTAEEREYIDAKCPFTGTVSIRGRVLRGVVVSTKMRRTITVSYTHLTLPTICSV